MTNTRRKSKKPKATVPSSPAKAKQTTAPTSQTPPTPGDHDTGTTTSKPPTKKANTPASSSIENKQVRHIFPSYKRRFRVLLAGHPDNSNQQQILKHYSIELGWVNGVQIPSDIKGIAFAYFATHELAEKAVKAWNGKDSYMFLQRVSTPYRYRVDLPFNVANVKKVVSEVATIVSMNYSPSNGFWAVNVDKSLANKPTFLTELDATKTALRLSWDSDKKFDTEILKEIIVKEWKINPEIDAVFGNPSGSGALVKVNRAELQKSTVTKLIYVGDIVVTNLSYNPRINRPSLMTRVKEMVQQLVSASNIDPKLYVPTSAFDLLKSEVNTLVSSNQELAAANLVLETQVKELKEKLNLETCSLNTDSII